MISTRPFLDGMSKKRPLSAALMLALTLVLSLAASSAAGAGFATLYSFCSQSGCTDGAGPGALIQGTDGNLYGATTGGGLGAGTLFQITPSGVLTTLYAFCATAGCPDGQTPSALFQATDGNFYGTTSAGGIGAGGIGGGTIFQLTQSGSFTTLYAFCSQPNCADGYASAAPLIQGTTGNLYGTTESGGADGYGSIFTLTLPPSATFVTLHGLVCASDNCPEGYSPESPLVQATNGNFYGTTEESAYTSQGSIYQVTPGGVFTSLYTFCGASGCPDGALPHGALIQGSDGNLYGTTAGGGAYGEGSVFKMTLSGTLTTLYSFCATTNCPDGAAPWAGLVQASDGNFYGTTYSGGANNKGTVFQISPSGTLRTLYSFCATTGCPDGALPYAALIEGTNGILYGTTEFGGSAGAGTVFSITPPPPPQSAPIVTAVVTGTLGNLDSLNLGPTGWYVSPATISWTVTGNPKPKKSGCGTVTIRNSKGTTRTCTATNSLGTASESVTVQVDTKPPTVRIKVPVDGATYKLNRVVDASYSCSTGGASGLADCQAGDVYTTVVGYPSLCTSPAPASCDIATPDGFPLDTSTPGLHHLVASGWDNAGNMTTVVHSYTVTP